MIILLKLVWLNFDGSTSRKKYTSIVSKEFCMNTYIIEITSNVDETIKLCEKYDKCDNLVCLRDSSYSHGIYEIEKIISAVRKAKVGLFVDLTRNSNSKIDGLMQKADMLFCIEYSKFDMNYCYIERYRRDFIVLISYIDASKLTQEQIKALVRLDISIYVDITNEDLNIIPSIYDNFVVHGFSRLLRFCTLKKISCNVNCVSGFITPKELNEFNCKSNVDLKREISRLTKNALKRYNQSLKKETKNAAILLVNVDTNIYSYFRMPNLGIEYLNTIIHNAGYAVECLYLTRWNLMEKLEETLANGFAKVVGFSCMYDNIDAVANAINCLKEKYNNVVFYIGGPHANDLGESFLQKNKVDYIMVGESENVIIDFVNYTISNIGVRENLHNLRYIDHNKGSYVETPRSKLIFNLDSLPFPNYVYEKNDNLSAAGIITGRGCPYKCAFCYEGNKERTVRYRSVKNVIEEISLLIKNNRNVNRIQFYDDTFTLDQSRVREICTFMKPLYDEYGLMWVCEIHCQTVYNNPDLVKTMVESGMISAQVGLESGNNRILKLLNKKTTTDMIMRTIEICKDAGVYSLQGNLIIGAAGENKDDLQNNYNFAREVIELGKGMFELEVAMFWPFSNTPIAINPSLYGIEIIPEQYEYSIHCMGNMVSRTNTLSRNELIGHFHELKKVINDTYTKVSASLNRDEIAKHWINGQFNVKSAWGRTLSTYDYLNSYFKAKEQVSKKIDNSIGYPIRTFENLTYDENVIIVPKTNIRLSLVESRIIELCTGRNKPEEIARKLDFENCMVLKILEKLEEKMLIFYSYI